MADDDQQQEQPERTVPYDRFKQVNDKLAEERRRTAEMESRLEALEDADKPHLERLTKDLERAAKRAEEAEQRAAEAENARMRDQRSAWVTAAAAKHNFHDPELAARMVNLDEFEDAKQAERAVRELAKEKTFLIREDPKQSPLQRVGIAGAEDERDAAAGLVTPEEQQRQWGNELLQKIEQRTSRAPLGGE